MSMVEVKRRRRSTARCSRKYPSSYSSSIKRGSALSPTARSSSYIARRRFVKHFTRSYVRCPLIQAKSYQQIAVLGQTIQQAVNIAHVIVEMGRNAQIVVAARRDYAIAL